MKRLVVIGGGGHAAVVAEAARLAGQWRDICFVDDRFPEISDVVGLRVEGKTAIAHTLVDEQTEFVVAIGDNDTRLQLQAAIEASGGQLASVIHPSAAISASATVDSGSMILAQAAVNARTQIGSACIVNTGATVDHDCRLANGVHISPGAHLAGGVSVGEKAWVGIGATVVNNVSIGKHSIVGAAACVLDDVSDGQTVVGVPARVLS